MYGSRRKIIFFYIILIFQVLWLLCLINFQYTHHVIYSNYINSIGEKDVKLNFLLSQLSNRDDVWGFCWIIIVFLNLYLTRFYTTVLEDSFSCRIHPITFLSRNIFSYIRGIIGVGSIIAFIYGFAFLHGITVTKVLANLAIVQGKTNALEKIDIYYNFVSNMVYWQYFMLSINIVIIIINIKQMRVKSIL